VRSAGVREVAALSLEGVPEWIEIGSALFQGERKLAAVASQRPGEDLIGWAQAALALGEQVAACEVLIAAPVHPARVRELAADLARLGVRAHLLAVPGLADPADETFDLETVPAAAAPLDEDSPVYERVVSILQGAAAVTSCGGVRATSSGCALYLRGVLAARVRREAEGVAVSIVVPDKRRVFVNDGNFPRWGVDLHEMVVQLAQDPRVGSAGRGAPDADAAAADARVRVTARWVPCSPEGALFVDWVGVDSQGRAHVGIARERVRLADAVALATARHVVGAARETWAPGSQGPVLVSVSAAHVDAGAQQLLDVLLEGPPTRAAERRAWSPPPAGIALEPELPPDEIAPSEEAEAGEAEREERSFELSRERRGRRRGRRRRRGRGGDRFQPGGASGLAGEAAAEKLSLDAEPEDEGPDDGLEGDVADAFDEPVGEEREPEGEVERAGDDDADERAFAAAPIARTEAVELEPEPAAAAELEPAPEPEEAPRELPRRRRQRATLVVRNDPDAILAGLVLARDRRSITSFRVVRQEDLINYLKGPANDVSEADDLLVVGFTAQPHARELLQVAELFRGRLQWFDHHPWPIEDLEALRNALGSESVLIEDAANPLPLVTEVTERRSRFTDKLVDLSARRLSENDMLRWGYRMVGLIQRMAAHPGEHRSAIGPVLAGKPAELPSPEGVYTDEARWMEENDPRLVCFGEYELAVCEVPEGLDAGEIGRRVRATTGARLSLCARRGEDLVLLGCNEEKRPLNVTGLVESLGATHPWAHARPSADRVGRIWIEERAAHPERLEALIGEIVRHRSVLHG
jgi:hypothetical protein